MHRSRHPAATFGGPHDKRFDDGDIRYTMIPLYYFSFVSTKSLVIHVPNLLASLTNNINTLNFHK